MTDVEISGTVVHIRKVSRKLVFFDIIIGDTDAKKDRRQAIVVKAWAPGSPELVARINRGPDKLHGGDVVRVRGSYEALAGDFAAADYDVTERWSARHPTQTFSPIPPPPLVVVADGNNITAALGDNSDSERQLCKFFLNTGRCAAADSCRFHHNQSVKSARQARLDFVGAKLAARWQRHESDNFPPDTVVSSAAKRAEIFARWIAERFGGESDASCVILDVGGGRGDLSFELAVKLGLACWTLDPRPQKFRRWQLKLMRKLGSGNGSNSVGDGAGQPALLPVHRQELFSPEFFVKSGLDQSRIRLVVGKTF